MAGRFSVETIFKAVDRITAPITRMQARVQKFTRATGRGFRSLNRNVDKFTQGVKTSALAISAALLLTSGAMAKVITTGADFEQTLVSAAAKFPGEIRKGTAAFEQLELAARKTGATTEFSASQSAQALNFLAMAGFNAQNSIAALPGVVDLATAASIDLATATDVATDSLGAFGLMSKDSVQLGKNLARVNDVIAKTTTSANTTVETLFETIKDGAPVATTAGASLETFAALAGELANAGIKGSRAGTTLKNMFLTLSAPAGKAGKILRRLGIVTKDSDGNMRDVVDILGDLGKSLDGLGTADRSGVLEGIFGKIPIAGVNVLLASGSERLREYRQELIGASGASSKMASVMRDTVQGRLNSLKSAVEGVSISIFSMNEGPLSGAIEKMTEWVRANEKLIATNISDFVATIVENLDDIVLTLKRIGAAVAFVFALSAALKAATVASIAFNAAMLLVRATMILFRTTVIAVTASVLLFKIGMAGFVTVMTSLPKVLAAARVALLLLNLAFVANPVGLVVAGVVALVVVAGEMLGAWEPVKKFLGEMWDEFMPSIDDVKNAIDDLISFADPVMAAWQPVSDFFSDLGAALGSFAFDTVQAFDTAKDFLGFGEDDAASNVVPLVPKIKAPRVPAASILPPAANNVVPFVPKVKAPTVAPALNGSAVDNVIPVDFSAEQPVDNGANVISPQERTARSIEELRTTTTAEVVIKDETGRAELKEDKSGLKGGIKLMQTGTF